MIIVNIYWNDLSEAGQDTLINAGFIVNDAQRREHEPIGVIKTETRDAIEDDAAFKRRYHYLIPH